MFSTIAGFNTHFNLNDKVTLEFGIIHFYADRFPADLSKTGLNSRFQTVELI